jgi:hypothetical protein
MCQAGFVRRDPARQSLAGPARSALLNSCRGSRNVRRVYCSVCGSEVTKEAAVPEEFVDDDPEYQLDADDDDDDAIAELTPTDPESIPPDEGDAGEAGSREARG